MFHTGVVYVPYVPLAVQERCLADGPKPRCNNTFVGHLMERIAMDISGAYPTSKSGHRFLLVTDYFSKCSDAIPTKHTKAPYVASKLVNKFISIHGVPLQMHTNCASNFESKIF